MCDRVSLKYPSRPAVEPHSYYMNHIKGWTMERQHNESEYDSFCSDPTVWNSYPYQLNHERPHDLTYPARRVHEQELIDFTTPYQEFPANASRHISGQRLSRFPPTTSNAAKGEPLSVENYTFSDPFWDSNRDRYPPPSSYPPNGYIPANAYSSIPLYGQTPSPVKCQQHTRQVLNHSSRPFCVDGKRTLSAEQEESDAGLDSDTRQKALKFPWMKTTKSHHYEWKAQWQQGKSCLFTAFKGIGLL